MSPLSAQSGHARVHCKYPFLGVKRTWRLHCEMSAFDAVDGASSAASKWYRMIASKPERFKEVMPGNEMAFEVFKELARTRRRNADTVDPGIGRTRLGQRTLKCVFLIGTRSAHSIRASGLTAAQTGRTHDRTRPMLQQRQKVLAKAPSTHDPKRTSDRRRSGPPSHCYWAMLKLPYPPPSDRGGFPLLLIMAGTHLQSRREGTTTCQTKPQRVPPC